MARVLAHHEKGRFAPPKEMPKDAKALTKDISSSPASASNATPGSGPKRRSIRKLQEAAHQDQTAELYIVISNIRKKLNFKSNFPKDDERPTKRPRLEKIKCQCNLTIWDNREPLPNPEPLVRKTQMCALSVKGNNESGAFVDIELEEVFAVKSTDLRISSNRKDDLTLGIGDSYFLEIKIMPIKAGEEWPPIPILGKSDGDHFAGLTKAVSDKLQGALVARYMHLPTAPDPSVPLSVFYLHEGRAYRTKYGLEVNAQWAKPGACQIEIKKEKSFDPGLNPWSLDDEGRLFGKEIPSKPQKQAVEKDTHTSYIFDIGSLKNEPKEFRTVSTVGLHCPICPSAAFKALQELQLHLINLHSKYKFTVKNESCYPESHNLMSVAFTVSAAELPRARKLDNIKEEHEMDWIAPAAPLDVPAYIDGDHTWLGIPNKKKGASGSNSSIITDPFTQIRKENHGFLPAENVPDFRVPRRKRHPIIKLRTITTNNKVMYTSVSHRPLHLDEDARSESDDEMDDDWYLQRNIESLDTGSCRDPDVNPFEREFQKRWNRHRLSEKLGHPRYVSDCVVRFVKKERAWIVSCDETKRIFFKFCAELMAMKVIDANVIRGCQSILLNPPKTDTAIGPRTNSAADEDVSMSDLTRIQRRSHAHSHPQSFIKNYPPRNDGSFSGAAMPTQLRYGQSIQRSNSFMIAASALQSWTSASSRQTRAEAMLSLPTGKCGVCMNVIFDPINDGARCSDPKCEAPGVIYHSKCMGPYMRLATAGPTIGAVEELDTEKMPWICGLCTDRMIDDKMIEEAKAVDKGKGKGKDVRTDPGREINTTQTMSDLTPKAPSNFTGIEMGNTVGSTISGSMSRMSVTTSSGPATTKTGLFRGRFF